MNSTEKPGRQADRYEKRFGENLRRLRTAAGLSQRELAEAATGPLKKISKPEVNRLEAGTQSWRALHAFIFAEVFKVGPGELLGIEGLASPLKLDMEGEALSPRESALIRHLRDGNNEAALLVLAGMVTNAPREER